MTVGHAGAAVQPFHVAPGRIARAFRLLMGWVYLLGAGSHVYFGLFRAQGYEDMAEWSPPWNAVGAWFWDDVFMPNARMMALGLALVELAIGSLLVSRRDGTVRLGIVGAGGFHVALLVVFGMWVYTIPMIVAFALLLRYDFEEDGG